MNGFYFWPGFIIGLFAGIFIAGLFILSYLHKLWYGSYFVDTKNLPLTQKIKEKLGLDEDYLLK